MKKIFTYLILLLTLTATAQAQTPQDQEYETVMLKMLEVSKASDAMKQIAPQIINIIKQQAPEAPQEFWTELETSMLDMFQQILKAMTPVYQKYLTIDDLKGIIAFYESPVGKKLAETNAQIAMETMPIAQKIAQETMQKLMEKAKEKGYLKQ